DFHVTGVQTCALPILNPRYTVGRSVEEPLRALSKEDADERRSLVISALDQVGLTPGAAFAGRYPHELSGGQRQRVAIARAIVLQIGRASCREREEVWV